MKKSVICRLVCLALALVMTFGLCACPAGDPATGTTGTSGTSGTSGTTGAGGSVNRPETEEQRLSSTNYGDAAALENAGTVIEEGAFVLTGRTPNEASAIEITAVEFAKKITRGGLTEGATYRITDTAPITLENIPDKSYDVKNAVVIASGGMIIRDCGAITLRNLTLISDAGISLVSSSEITLETVETVSSATALSLDANSARATFKSVRAIGAIAVDNASNDLYLLDCYLEGKTLAVRDTAAEVGALIRRTYIKTEGDGIEISSTGTDIRHTVITGSANGTGILAGEGTRDLLVAENLFRGFQLSAYLKKATNSAVLFNSLTNLLGEENTNLYLTDNKVSGEFSLHSNNYLIADRNETVAPDRITQSGNENTNGDTVTDEEARLEVGADTNLLPHINKELFAGTPRTEFVRTEDRSELTLDTAITASEDAVCIIAPGAYVVNFTMNFDYHDSNRTIYAYGVLAERTNYGGTSVSISNLSNLSIYGLTFDHTENSMGQAVVLKKNSDKTITLLAGAGMLPDWTDSNYYNWQDRYGAFYGYRDGSPYPYADMGCNSCVFNADGTMTIRLSGSNYERVQVGDTICIRGKGNGSVSITGSAGVLLEDFTLLGGAGFGLHEVDCIGQNTYYRCAITPGYPAIIDEDTYARYLEAEETYGVDFGIYVDEQGRYRGTTPKVSTVDATHNANNVSGTKVVSCLFESMCDDGTNQKSSFGFLNGYTKNGDGTVTLKISSIGRALAKGNTLHIYNEDGGLFCDTEVLSTNGREGTAYLVTVAEAACDFSVLQGYNLNATKKEDSKKILAVNATFASDGFLFDNTVVQNIRSRGLLLKSSNGTVKNCTLKNIGMAAIAIHYEISWGESGISRGLTVENNLIHHTGFFNTGNIIYSAISVDGLNKKTMNEKYMTYRDIVIRGNRIETRQGMYAVQLTGAMNVTVENNYLGARVPETAESFRQPILVYYSKNITVSGNTFPEWCDSPETRIEIKGGADGLGGADLEGYYGYE